MEVIIDSKTYEVIKNVKDALDVEDLEGKITDYYDSFDYILGDYAYGKVRLKGFNDKENKNFKPVNDINKVDEYIESGMRTKEAIGLVAKEMACKKNELYEAYHKR